MFWRGVLGYLPVNIVQAAAGFGSILVFTRLLSPAAYGDYALAFSVSSLIHTVLVTWIEAAMARFYVAEPEGEPRRRLFATLYGAFALFASLGPLAGVLVLAFAPLPLQLRFAIAAGLISVAARGLLKLAQERRRAAGEVRGFAVVDMATTGGAFILGAGLALAGFGAASPFAGLGAASAVCLIWTLPAELKEVRQGKLDRGRLRTYAAYGVPVSLSLMLSITLASTDRFVLAGFVGEAAVGAYHAGYSLSNRTLDVIFLWLGMAGSPATVAALERGGESALRRTANHQASLMLLIAVPAAVGLALVSRPLAQVMVGPQLAAQAARVTPWIAAGALFSGLTTHYLHTAFTLSRRTRRQLLAVAIPAAANLGLCFLLIPRYGLDGALWATAASYGVGLVASYVLMQGCLPLPVPWDTLGRAAVASAAMALVVTRLPELGGVVELLLKAGLGALTYAVVALALDAGGARSEGSRWIKGLQARGAA